MKTSLNGRIYGRFSSKPQEKGDSYRQQVEGAIEYAKIKGFKIVAEPYFDAGVSGKAGLNLEKELGRYRKEAKAGEILLVYIQDRFGRQNPILLTALIYEICLQGIEIHIWGENKIINAENMQEMGGQISTFIASATGYQENQRKIKRLNDVFKQTVELAKQGIPSLNIKKCLPELFQWDGKKFYAPEERAEIIRRIFSEYCAGKGTTTISRGLNNDGIPTIYKRNKQTVADVKAWMEPTIKNILLNKAYNGIVTINGEVFYGLIPKVVTDEVFNKVQMLRSRWAKRSGNHSPDNRTNNLFANICFCPHCKGTVNVNICRRNGKPDYYAYRCKNAKVQSCKHPHKMLDAKLIEYGFFKTFFNRGAHSLLKDENRNFELKEKIEATKIKIQNTNKAIENLYDLVEQGDKEAAKRITKRRTDKDDAETELTVLQAKLTEYGEFDGNIATVYNIVTMQDIWNGKKKIVSIDNLLSDNENRKKLTIILPTLFSRVVIDCINSNVEALDKDGKSLGSFNPKSFKDEIKNILRYTTNTDMTETSFEPPPRTYQPRQTKGTAKLPARKPAKRENVKEFIKDYQARTKDKK